MKLKNIFLAAGAALMLAGCSNGGSEKSVRTLADYDNVTPADSLIYYFGQLRALDYWNSARRDSTLATAENREEYLKGLRAGMDAARQSEAYNQGLFVGVQVAMNMQDFAEDYGVRFNREILFNAISDGLLNDSAVNAGEANQGFRMVLDRLNIMKEENDRKMAAETLTEAAKAAGWTKISETLYAAPAKGETGAKIKSGDTIGLNVVVSNLDGKEIDRRNSESMTVGDTFPGPVTEAVKHMSLGEERTFYTTGPALFGRFTERYNIKPTQVIALTITTMPAKVNKPEAAE